MSISYKRIIPFVIFICLIAAALILPDVTFAEGQDKEAEKVSEGWECESLVGERITPDMIPGEKKSGLSLDYVETKNIPTVVIVIGLNNISYDNSYDWSETMFGNTDSIREYFLDMSYRKVSFKAVNEASYFGRDGNTNTADDWNDGVIHVNVNRNHRNWGLDDEADRAELTRTLYDGLMQASSYIDITQYDADGDGDIEPQELTVIFVVAGYGWTLSHRAFDESLYLRSHRFTFTGAISLYNVKDLSKPQITKNGETVTLDPYIVTTEKAEEYDSKTGKTTVIQGLYGTIAHELGHQLGLPDQYDTVKNSDEKPWEGYGVQYTSLMARGNYAVDENGTDRPASLDPWSRIFLGWMTPQTISAAGVYTATSQDYSDIEAPKKVFRINMPYDGEYYLIENRYAEKWDSGIVKKCYPYNQTKGRMGGLLIWHIDEKVIDECPSDTAVAYRELNNPEHRPAIMPLFPETDVNGNYTLIGSNGPNAFRPFFDKYLWDNVYIYIGTYLDLPTYCGADILCKPAEREYSNHRIQFLSDAGKSMDFRYVPSDHTHKWRRSYGDVPEDICENGGYYESIRTCSLCGEERRSWVYHDPGHFRVRHLYGIEATCTRDGRKDHYWCIHCGKKYLDEEMTEEATDEDIVIPGGHQYEAIFITPPTYDNDGIIEYDCRICHTGYWDSIPQLDHRDKPGDDGTACGHGAAIQKADKAIRKSSSEKDMPGSTFSPVKLTSTKQGKRSIKLSWKSTEDYMNNVADCYYVYGAKCGKSKFRKLKTVYGTSVTIKKIGSKKLSPRTYYKFIVVAVHDDSEEVLSTSRTVHVATKGSRTRANYTGVSVSSKAVKKAAKMKEGQTVSLKAKARKKSGTKVVPHGKLRYESMDKSVASVTSKGVIKAKSPGECTVYVYTQNGKYKKIHVEVIYD